MNLQCMSDTRLIQAFEALHAKQEADRAYKKWARENASHVLLTSDVPIEDRLGAVASEMVLRGLLTVRTGQDGHEKEADRR